MQNINCVYCGLKDSILYKVDVLFLSGSKETKIRFPSQRICFLHLQNLMLFKKQMEDYHLNCGILNHLWEGISLQFAISFVPTSVETNTRDGAEENPEGTLPLR